MSADSTQSPILKPSLIDVVVLSLSTLAACGLWLIGSGKELWYSERFVQVIANQPWREMIELLRFENNPPFIFVITRFWQALFGNGEVTLRVLSLLPTLAWLWVLFRLARELAGRSVAVTAVLIGSVSGMVVMQAQELRMYPWLLLWTTIALLLMWSYFQVPRALKLVVLSLVHVLGLYTHYTYLFVTLLITGWLLLKRWKYWGQIVLQVSVVALAFLPWFWYSLWPLLRDLSNTLGVQQASAPLWELALLPFRIFVPPLFGENRLVFLLRMMVSVVIGVAFVLGIKQIFIKPEEVNEQPRLKTGLKPVLWFMVLYIVFGIAGLMVMRLTLAKYATILIPAVSILIAVGVSKFPLQNSIRVVILGIVLAGTAMVSALHARSPYVAYRAAAAIVESNEQPGDRILIYPFNDEIALKPYYHGSLQVIGFFPLSNPGQVTLIDNVRYNFRSDLNVQNIERLTQYVGDAKRVWFFYDVTIQPGYWNADLIDNWFRKHGYASTTYRGVFRNVPPLLIRYDR